MHHSQGRMTEGMGAGVHGWDGKTLSTFLWCTLADSLHISQACAECSGTVHGQLCSATSLWYWFPSDETILAHKVCGTLSHHVTRSQDFVNERCSLIAESEGKQSLLSCDTPYNFRFLAQDLGTFLVFSWLEIINWVILQKNGKACSRCQRTKCAHWKAIVKEGTNGSSFFSCFADLISWVFCYSASSSVSMASWRAWKIGV